MSERMWLRATCAAIVLFAAPGLAAAQTKQPRFSGPLKIQIGLDEFGDPAYADCGELALYKTGQGGGREWRLEGTCDELVELLVPTAPPTPTPKPTGGGVITPSPTPRVTGSAQCPDGYFSKVSTGYAIPNVTLEEQREYTYCVDLPTSSYKYFQLYTINKGNSSCSNLEVETIAPSGKRFMDWGPAPVVTSLAEKGLWQVRMFLHEGCKRYEFQIPF